MESSTSSTPKASNSGVLLPQLDAIDKLWRGAREEGQEPVMLLGIIDDRAVECAEKMSRTTRTDRSASWKTSAGAGVSATRF